MTPIENKPVKLSPIMKDVIEKMRAGYRLEAEGKNQICFFLLKEDHIKKLNWNTAYFMKRRGLIEYIRTNATGFWGKTHIYDLTELGKTIKL